MDSVKVLAFSMCISVVVGSVLSMIVPSNAKQNIMKIVISAFVLVGLITPILSLFNKNKFYSNAHTTEASIRQPQCISELNESVIAELERASASSIFPIFQQELMENGIDEVFGLGIELISQNDGVDIKKVNITIGDLHMIEKDNLEKYLEKKIGLPIEVEVFEREES